MGLPTDSLGIRLLGLPSSTMTHESTSGKRLI